MVRLRLVLRRIVLELVEVTVAVGESLTGRGRELEAAPLIPCAILVRTEIDIINGAAAALARLPELRLWQFRDYLALPFL